MPIIRKAKEENEPLSLREAMGRLFDESFWSPFDFSVPVIRGRWLAYPKTDVSETDREVTVVANIPGIDPDKIEIDAGDSSIRLSGKLEKEAEEKGRQFYRYEREYGEFSREVPLPAKVDPDKVSAKAKNGVLTITLPKIEKESRKKIEIKKES